MDKGKQMNDVVFFVRCNTRLIKKAGTWKDTDWAKEERLQELAKPMGEIRRYISWDNDYGITKWYLYRERLKQLRKKVQGPLQRGYWYRKYDRTGKFVYP